MPMQKRLLIVLLSVIVIVSYTMQSGHVQQDVTPSNKLLTIHPAESNDVLTNPGIGFSDFHFAWGQGALSLSKHPHSGTEYFRFYWNEIEPARGQIDFAKVDAIIKQAEKRANSMNFAFRLMTLDSHHSGSKIPQWLINLGINGTWVDDGLTFVPDYSDVVFMAESKRLIEAFGKRYNNNPQIDHVDIGMVGSWGEWNLAGIPNSKPLHELYAAEILNQYVDWHQQAFPDKPTVMLIGAGKSLTYAVAKGSGWRADCLGDWHRFSPTWSHMKNDYPQRIAQATIEFPQFNDAWKIAPVQFETCDNMQRWKQVENYSLETVQATFDWALQQHASLINAKSGHVPPEYRAIVDSTLKKLGYRFVLRGLAHPQNIENNQLKLSMNWENIGVAPSYNQYPLAVRLKDKNDNIVAQIESDIDMRKWLPGEHQVKIMLPIVHEIGQGRYDIEIAFLDDKKQAKLQLAIEGKRDDGWYFVSKVNVL